MRDMRRAGLGGQPQHCITLTKKKGEKTHIKKCFFMVGPLRLHPPYTNSLVVHATFFSYFFSLETDFDNFFFFFPIFGVKQPDLREKK